MPPESAAYHSCRSIPCWPFQMKYSFSKWFQMLFKIFSRIYRILSKRIVSIPSALTGTSAGPMLSHGTYTVFSPAIPASFRSLQAVAINSSKFRHLLRIGTKRIFKPHPPRFRSQVYLWRQSCSNSQSTVFLCDHFLKP